MKYICIHGHFYQPPRENPWLDKIEYQKSAKPYHDWNERVSLECYGPNGYSRILNMDKKISHIQNNYARISFNFGPTLLVWLEKNQPTIYKSIIEADSLSSKRYNGHGSAVAQAYNHTILPLNSRSDKQVQVKWGISDFVSRYNRFPEGMWLAETAVDIECLEVLAENGIKFTILSPYQALAVRKINTDTWVDVPNAKINTKRPYLINLPSGNDIVVFFYDHLISQSVAFEKLLFNGSSFARRLTSSLDNKQTDEPQIVHIATDGETYGHHHELGDMALAYCIKTLDEVEDVSLVNYGYFLSKHKPTWEAKIVENTSWSCSHGISRWMSDCGCSSGINSSWNQKWRQPLRDSLDWLREKVDTLIEKEGNIYLKDFQHAKDNYISLILDRNPESKERFFQEHQKFELGWMERRRTFRLLEMFRNAQLMYTSCGWFFDEISGLETTQVLIYADRVLQLYSQATQVSLTDEFLNKLETAKSNIVDVKDGKAHFLNQVRPRRLSFQRIVMHAVLLSIFSNTSVGDEISYGNYFLTVVSHKSFQAGFSKLVVGEAQVRSVITGHLRKYEYIVVYIGQAHFSGRVFNLEKEVCMDKEKVDAIVKGFRDLQVVQVVLQIDRMRGGKRFDFLSLSREHQNEILKKLIVEDLEFAVSSSEQVFLKNYAMLNMGRSLMLDPPTILKRNINLVINSRIIDFLKSNENNYSKLEQIASDVKLWDVDLYNEEIERSSSQKVLSLMMRTRSSLTDGKGLETILMMLRILKRLDIKMNLWEIQNSYFNIARKIKKKIEDVNGELAEDKKKNFEIFCLIGTELDIDPLVTSSIGSIIKQ